MHLAREAHFLPVASFPRSARRGPPGRRGGDPGCDRGWRPGHQSQCRDGDAQYTDLPRPSPRSRLRDPAWRHRGRCGRKSGLAGQFGTYPASRVHTGRCLRPARPPRRNVEPGPLRRAARAWCPRKRCDVPRGRQTYAAVRHQLCCSQGHRGHRIALVPVSLGQRIQYPTGAANRSRALGDTALDGRASGVSAPPGWSCRSL